MRKSQRKTELPLGDALFILSTAITSTHSLTDRSQTYRECPYRPTPIELFNAAIRFWTDKSHPEACLSIQNLAVSDEAEPIKHALMDWRAWRLEQFRKRAQRARRRRSPEANQAGSICATSRSRHKIGNGKHCWTLPLSRDHIERLDKLSEPKLNFPAQVMKIPPNFSNAVATVNGIESTLLPQAPKDFDDHY